MVPFVDSLVASIRSKSKQEWQEFFQERMTLAREYLRAHGEQGALIGFGIGIFIVLCFKLALLLACLGGLAYLLIQIIADS
jgi:hypothetical protein